MISCKMMTAGRVHLLEEALYSFLNLKGVEKSELIIVNDYPYQNLIFDHPQVKIVNFTELFPTIGEKDTYTHDLCQGDIIAVFDDDDIALPNHLENIDKYLQDNDIIHWGMGGFYNERIGKTPLIEFTQLGNSGIVYPKDSYIKVGKSPIINEGYDRVLVDNLHKLNNKVGYAVPQPKDISWIYRWATPTKNSVGCYHLSGGGDFVEGREDIRIRNFKYLEGLRKKGKLPVGDIHLKPKWKYNYIDLVKSHL